MTVGSGWIYQAAAIPVKGGQVCVVKSSSRKRWVVPKGCMEEGKTAGQIALQEAWEEAGLVGVLDPEPVGSYLYDKWGNTCHVLVFLMRVISQADDYPERALRERAWLEPGQALARIKDEGLRQVLRATLRSDRIKATAS